MTVYGLSERFLPGLIELDRSRTATGRLEQPVTYWNAFGILATLGLILAVRIAGDPRRPAALGQAAAAAGVPLGLGAYLSFTRGALAALVTRVCSSSLRWHRPCAKARCGASFQQ